jgi:WhiB family redox-sensing transcriptional regulator
VTPRTTPTTTDTDSDTRPTLDLRRPRWMAEAACKDMPVSVFVPDRFTPASLALALDVCRSCAVLDTCRAWAMALPDQLGVAGGTTEAERRAERRAAREAP